MPACKVDRCRKRCLESFPEDQRNILNTNFWKLPSNEERKAFILSTCSWLNVKRRITESERKQNTFKYNLKIADGEIADVCKTFF